MRDDLTDEEMQLELFFLFDHIEQRRLSPASASLMMLSFVNIMMETVVREAPIYLAPHKLAAAVPALHAVATSLNHLAAKIEAATATATQSAKPS